MEQLKNFASSTLASPINNSATALTVASASSFPTEGNFRIVVDSEIMLVTGVSGGTFTVTRGHENTTATNHTSGSSVQHKLTAGGLTQAIQDLSLEAAELDGAVSTIATDDLTASRALVSNGSGKVAVSSVTSTELGYLSGVTAAIQAQIDAKVSSNSTVYVSTSPGTDARNVIQPSASTVCPLTIMGAASQSDDLLQVQNSSGTVQSKITKEGYLRIESSHSYTNFDQILLLRNSNVTSSITYYAYSGDGTFNLANTGIQMSDWGGVNRLYINGGSSGGIKLNNNQTIRIGDSYNDVMDVGFARDSAGVIKVTNGASGAGTLTASRLVSTVANGTAPMTVTSQTLVTNLNAQFLNGYSSGAFAFLNDYTNKVQIDGGSVNTSYNFDLSVSRDYYINVSGNIELTITNSNNCTAGFVLHIVTGGSTITWNTGEDYKWPGGSPPDLAAGDHIIAGKYDLATDQFYMSYTDYT